MFCDNFATIYFPKNFGGKPLLSTYLQSRCDISSRRLRRRASFYTKAVWSREKRRFALSLAFQSPLLIFFHFFLSHICVYVCLTVFISIYLSIHQWIFVTMSVYPPIYLYIYLSLYLSTYLHTSICIYLPFYQLSTFFLCLSICVSA
jgi:hypothetical protein